MIISRKQLEILRNNYAGHAFSVDEKGEVFIKLGDLIETIEFLWRVKMEPVKVEKDDALLEHPKIVLIGRLRWLELVLGLTEKV